MTKTQTIGSIKNGQLGISNLRRFKQDLKSFPDCDIVLIVKKKGKRSNQFNRYYFGVVLTEILHELTNRGYQIESTEDLHLMMKLKFVSDKAVDMNTGEVYLEVPKMTSVMNNIEFGEYVEKVKMWASQSLGIYIPEPSEQTKLYQ